MESLWERTAACPEFERQDQDIRTGVLIIGDSDHPGKKRKLQDFARQYYPNAVENCHWSTQDYKFLDRVPYIAP